MYTKDWFENGLKFTQQMDTSDDCAYYQDRDGNLLMKVDSSGSAYDAQGNHLGDFKMNYPKDSWKYVPNEGPEIVTDWWNLFDRVEPFVVGQLFGRGTLAEACAK